MTLAVRNGEYMNVGIGNGRAKRAVMAAIASASALVAFAAPAGAQAPLLDRSGLVLSFRDEFDTLNVADARDRQTWVGHNWKTWFSNGPDPQNMHNRTLPGNGESQVYADANWPERAPGAFPVDPLSVRDGVLRIRAEPAPAAFRDQIFGRPYTSGMIASWGMFAQRYGVFEARLRLPKGRGLWPAFWTLNATGGQPPEIDIMEFLGHDVHTTYVVAHSREKGRHVARNREVPHAMDVTAEFHVFAVDWRPRTLTYFIDGEQVMQIPTPPDMHRPMYMLLNLAVGGRWGGMPDAATRFPATYEVDWVRVWRRPADEPRPVPHKLNHSRKRRAR